MDNDADLLPAAEGSGVVYADKLHSHKHLACHRLKPCAEATMPLCCDMAMSRQEAGSKGGKETLRRYGRLHMKELGKRGIRATADKYFGGSIAECMSYLRKKAAELQIVALADQEGMTCVEMPILLDPDFDPFFDEPPPTWQQRLAAGKPRSRVR